MEVAALGLKVDAAGVDVAAKSLENLTTQGARAEKAIAGVDAASTKTQRTLKQLGDGSAAAGMGQVNAAAVQMASKLGGVSTAARAGITTLQGLEAAVNSLTSSERKYIQTLMDEARMLNMGQGERAAYIAQTKGMSESAQALARALGNKTEELQKARAATVGAADAMGVLKTAVAAALSIGGLKQLADMADAMTNVNSRLKLVTSSSTELARVQSDLFGVAQSSRTRFVDLADTYAQMARATKDLGVSQKDMLQVTQTISQAVTISGGSAASAQAALVQLSQGFASGALRGEELNSVLEQTPRLAQAIAQGLGVSTGELRKLGSEGELTAEKVLGALKKSSTQVQLDFDQMSVTVEQSLTRVSNSMLNLVGTVDKLTGASSGVAGMFSRFSTNLDALDGQIKTMAGTNSLSDFFFVAFNKEQDLNAELAISQKELDELKARLEKAPENIYLRSATVDAQNLVNKLIEAKARLKELNEGAAGSNPADAYMSYPTRSQSYAKYAKQQEDSEKALTEVRMRAAGINQQYFKDLKTYQEALALGTISTEGYTKAVSELAIKTYESSTAGKEAAKQHKEGASAAKAEQTEYSRLMAAIIGKTEQNKEELKFGRQLNDADKLRIMLTAQLEAGSKKLSAAHAARAKAALQDFDESEKAVKAAHDLKKAIEGDISAFEKLGQQRESSLKSLQDLVRKMQQEEEAYSLSAAAGISLAEAMERLTIARLQDHLAMARSGAESQATIDALERELAARQKLLGAIQTKEFREANKKATEEAAKDWEKVSQTISRTLSDYIMAGGKDAATYLKRLFATLVLEPTVQTAVGTLMGVKDPTGGRGGIDLGGGLTDWSTWGSKGADWLFDQGVGMSFRGFEGLGSSMQSLGVTVGRLDTALKGLPGMSGGIGSAAGYLGSIYALTQGKVGTGIGSAIGTWALPGIGTMIGGALGGLVDDLFGGDDIPRYAATAEYRGGVTSKGWTPDGQWNDALYPTVNGLAGAIGSALDATAKTFGKAAGYELFASFSKDADGNGVFGALNITGPDGKRLVDWSQYNKDWGGRFFSDGEAGEKEFMAAITADVKTAFQAMDLPGWSKQLIGAAEDINGINAALQQIGAVKAVFDGLGQSMQMFSGISGELQTQLLQTSGSMDALAGNAGAFYEGFFSEQERMDALQKQLRESLSGLDLSIDPAMGEAAKEQFRATVEAAMSAGQGELAAKLLALSGSFATAADYAQKATDSLRSSLIGLEGKFAGGGFSRQYQAEDLASQVQGLLSGVGISKDAGVLAQTLLSATSADVESYFREIWNVLPTDEARQKLVNVAGSMLDLAAAATVAEEAAKAAASEREGLEQRWLQAIGDTAEMRRRELEALDPSNRALLEMIYGLEDAKQSMADLTAASQQAAQKAAAAWQGWGTAAGLGAQYLGDTSGLEARRAILNAQIKASTDPAERLSKLQELISVEQAIGQAQQASRKTELEAINARQSALQKEISAAQQLLSAAQSLGDYAHSLQFGATSGLSDADRLAALSGEYNSLIGKARGGDADALKQLQGVSGDYLSLAQTLAVSGSDYSVLSGRMAAEMEALAKGQELFAQSQVTGYEAQIAQLAQQSELLSAQVDLSDGTKSLIAKSMIDQAEVWDRENTQALTLQELQQRAVDSLALMPAGIASAIKPTIESSATYLANRLGGTVSSALWSLAEMLGMDGSHATGLSYVPFDGYRAELHRGERVLTAEENRMFSAPRSFVMQGGQGVSGLVAELMTEVRALRTQVAALQRPMEQTAAATTQHAEQFDNATAGGNGMAVSIMEQAAPLQVKEVA